MPTRINDLGQTVIGREKVSFHDSDEKIHKIIAEGGAGCFLRDNEIIFQKLPELKLYKHNLTTEETAPFFPRGINELRAGNGRWEGWLGGVGMYGEIITLNKDAGLFDVGRDGTLAYRKDRNNVFGLTTNTGIDIPEAIVSFGLRVYDALNLVWSNERNQLRTHGAHSVHIGDKVFNPCLLRMFDKWFVLYHTDNLLKLRHLDSPKGKILNRGEDSFFPDGVFIDGKGIFRAAWSKTQGEGPNDFGYADARIDELTEDLSESGIVIPPIPNPPNPPEEKPPMGFRNERATVDAVNRDYPGLIVSDPGGFVDQVAHRLNKKDGAAHWGRKLKNDHVTLNLDALTYRENVNVERPIVNVDVIVASETPAAAPGWNDFGGTPVSNNGFWAPPQSGDRDSGVVNPPGGTTPPPSSGGEVTKAQFDALVNEVNDLKNTVRALTVNAAAPKKISLKAEANDKFVCAEGGGREPLIANRESDGPWETFEMRIK